MTPVLILPLLTPICDDEFGRQENNIAKGTDKTGVLILSEWQVRLMK